MFDTYKGRTLVQMKIHANQQSAEIERLLADKSRAMYLIWSHEHGAWWRPESCGYTTVLQSAGRYTREDALSICASVRNGWNIKTAPSEIPVLLDDAMECATRDLARAMKPCVEIEGSTSAKTSMNLPYPNPPHPQEKP